MVSLVLPWAQAAPVPLCSMAARLTWALSNQRVASGSLERPCCYSSAVKSAGLISSSDHLQGRGLYLVHCVFPFQNTGYPLAVSDIKKGRSSGLKGQ